MGGRDTVKQVHCSISQLLGKAACDGLCKVVYNYTTCSIKCTTSSTPCTVFITHQQNGKVSEMITPTLHFLCGLIEYSAVATVPCTKALCIGREDRSVYIVLLSDLCASQLFTISSEVPKPTVWGTSLVSSTLQVRRYHKHSGRHTGYDTATSIHTLTS